MGNTTKENAMIKHRQQDLGFLIPMGIMKKVYVNHQRQRL